MDQYPSSVCHINRTESSTNHVYYLVSLHLGGKKATNNRYVYSCYRIYARLLIYGNTVLVHYAKDTFKEKRAHLQPPSK